MKSFKEYIKEVGLAPTTTRPDQMDRENFQTRNDAARELDSRTNLQRSIDRDSKNGNLGAIQNLKPPHPSPSTPVLNPDAGHHVRDPEPEYGSGNKKIFSPD